MPVSAFALLVPPLAEEDLEVSGARNQLWWVHTLITRIFLTPGGYPLDRSPWRLFYD
jgi:hypothetical protein